MNIFLLNINIGKSWSWGGIESHSATLASLLSGKGHRVIMGCWNEGSVKVAGGLSLPSRRVTIRNSGDFGAVIRMMKIMRQEGIDIVIANAGREYWPASLAATMAGVKIVFIRHQVDRIRSTTRWLIAHYVSRVVAVSGAVKRALEMSGIPPEKIEVIYNSIPFEKFNPAVFDREKIRNELGIGDKDVVIGTVGKLHQGKGVFDLLHAVDKLAGKYQRIRVMFVGDGADRASLEQEAKKLSVHDRVIFAGVRRDVEKMYAAMDIFVLPSTCEEAFGMVLIEAMAMGKPVIGTAVGGIPEIVQDGITGLLVPPGDPHAVACAIERYMDDAAFAKKIALEGRKIVEQRFSDKAMRENFTKVLAEVGEMCS